MALDLLRNGAYCKRKRRWVRAHHGGARRREHARGRGAAIVGTSGDLPSAEKFNVASINEHVLAELDAFHDTAAAYIKRIWTETSLSLPSCI